MFARAQRSMGLEQTRINLGLGCYFITQTHNVRTWDSLHKGPFELRGFYFLMLTCF